MSEGNSVETDIIKSVASQRELNVNKLQRALSTLDEIHAPEYEDAIQECHQTQELRNQVEPKIEEAAESDAYTLVDSDGVIFWVDEYTGFGAYIHTGDGNTHYVGLELLANEFDFN